MPVLSNYKTIPDVLFYLTQKFEFRDEKPAFLEKVNGKFQPISYGRIYERTELFALGLASIGFRKGGKIAIISENRPEWMYSDLAILGLGGIDVPIYPISTSENILFILNDSEAAGIIVSNKFHLNKVEKIRNKCKYLKFIIVLNDLEQDEGKDIYSFNQICDLGRTFKFSSPNYFVDSARMVNENELCTIIYTSGTTGEPKGVMLTHKNIISNVKGGHDVFDIDYKDTFLSFLPLCHIYERTTGYLIAFSCGATIAFAESIEKVAPNILEVKPSIITAVPRLFERIYSKVIKNVESQSEAKQKLFYWALETARQYKDAVRANQIPVTLTLKFKMADKLVLSKVREKIGGSLRFIISGGAALSRELSLFFEALGILILEGYGLTESSPVLSVNRPNDYKFGTVGKPLPNVEIKIAPDGEILASGPGIMQGYYKNKKETEATLKSGWLHTGDIGVFDAEGFLIITDRKKHLFKTSGGKYVAPTPIENLFLASKYVDQFVLIGDRRMFLSALIVPDYEALKEYADANRIQYSSTDDLVQKKQIYEMLEKELAKFQKNLAGFEKIRKFTLLDKPLTIETGELTPSLKVKRKVIEERYSDLIDDMYKKFDE